MLPPPQVSPSSLFLFLLPRLSSWSVHIVKRASGSVEEPQANLSFRNPEPPRKLQGRFLQITDLHPDPLYRVGGSVSSGCHRKRPKKEKTRAGYLGTPYEFVILSSNLFSHFGDPQKHSSVFWGSTTRRIFTELRLLCRDCDSPLTLTNYTLDYLEEHWVDYIDFVVCALRLSHCSNFPAHSLTPPVLVDDNRDRRQRQACSFLSLTSRTNV